jgi:hypothetical protein
MLGRDAVYCGTTLHNVEEMVVADSAEKLEIFEQNNGVTSQEK